MKKDKAQEKAKKLIKKMQKEKKTCKHPDHHIEWDGNGAHCGSSNELYYEGKCTHCGQTIYEVFNRIGLFTENNNFIRE